MARNGGGQNKITEGVIWKQILFFFFPILIGTFFQQLYNTVDSMIVGRFVGKEALSCVSGSSAQVINLVVGFFTGLSAGASVLISQHFGAQNTEQLHKSLHTAYAFSIVGGIAAGIIGIFVTKPILRLMNTPPELIEESAKYVQVYFAGLIFIFIYNMGSAILRAIGDSKRPLYYLIVCCIINIILDLVLVVNCNMGVLGVAIATLIAQAVSAVLVTLALMYKTEGLTLTLRSIRIYGDMLSVILKIGFPSGLQACMYSISNMIVQSAVNEFGVDTMAAWGAYGKLDAIFWMVNSAFGIAATTFVGQNFGAGKMERVRKGTNQCLCMALITAIVLSGALIAGAELLFRIFTGDPDVVVIGVHMLQMITPSYFLYVFIEIYSGVLRAQGHVLVSTILTLLGICVSRIVWVTLLVPHGTMDQIILCYPVSWFLCAVSMIIYYHYKQKKIFEQYA